jgi:hypothetical protein
MKNDHHDLRRQGWDKWSEHFSKQSQTLCFAPEGSQPLLLASRPSVGCFVFAFVFLRLVLLVLIIIPEQLQENGTLLSFPYVCPKPVLVK